MKSKRIPISDYIEDLIEDSITDTDWDTSEFYQDILEVCLQHKDKVARNALKRLGCLIPDSEGRYCCNA